MHSDRIEWHFGKILQEGLGLDISDPNLLETPKRISRMYHEIFKGLGSEFSDFKAFPNEKNYQQLVMLDCIHFVSWCSHHFLPFEGLAWIGYIPDKVLIGASKPARLVDHYASRPQLQENLCHDVINSFDKAIKPRGTIVAMRALHGCMRCRGVKQTGGSGMITSALSGVLRSDSKAREEAMRYIMISLQMQRGG